MKIEMPNVPHRAVAETAEGKRLAEADLLPDNGGRDWRRFGPYLSDRQWGTVREDYSADGDAWNYLPHDHARSRAYRWGEDAIAGFADDTLAVCLGLALWNGADPILKERLFGLTNAEGNHGEDVKELYYYLDGTADALRTCGCSTSTRRRAFPYAAPPRGERPARPARIGEYELYRHRPVRRRPLLRRHRRVREGRRPTTSCHAPHDRQPRRQAGGDPALPAAALVAQQLDVDRRGGGQAASSPPSGDTSRELRAHPFLCPTLRLDCDGAPVAAVLRQRDEFPPRCYGTDAPGFLQGRHQRRSSSDGKPPERSTRRAPAPRWRRTIRCVVIAAHGTDVRSRVAAVGRPKQVQGGAGPTAFADFDAVHGGAPGGVRRVLRGPAEPASRTPTPALCSVRPSPACCGPSNITASTSADWLTGDPAEPRPAASNG